MSYQDAARTLLRDTVLDAVAELVRDRGWGDTSLNAVATRAGVSRQTIYNEFGSRQGLAQEYVLRDVDQFLLTVEQAVVANRHDAQVALASAFHVFLRAAAEDPLIKVIVSGDGSDGLLAMITTHGGPVLERATGQLAALFVTHWPQIPADGAALLAESVVRLAISHASLPSGPADRTAAGVTTVVGPYLETLLAGGVG